MSGGFVDRPTGDDTAARRVFLLVTYNFPPSAASGSHRLLGFVRHLGPHGWDAAVVAPRTTPYERVDPELARRVPPETAVYEAPFAWVRGTQRLGALFPFFVLRLALRRWMGRAEGVACRVIRDRPIRAIVTSGPPHVAHMVGLRLKRRYGLPWIADFRDPWIATNWTGSRGGLVRLRAAWAESRVMAEADVIVANAPRALDALQAAFPAHVGKIVAITNGYDPEVFEDLARRPDPEGRWTLVHPGQLYIGRTPLPLLDALGRVLADWPAGRPQPRLRLVGGGHDLKADLNEETRRRGLERVVSVEEHVPYRESLRAMVDADVLILLDTPGRRIGVPAKLYEYLGAGRPILALGEPDGDVAWVLRTSGVTHRIARPGEVAGIERAMRELMALGPDAAPAPGRLEFTRERLAGRLAELLDRLTGRAAERPLAVTAEDPS